VTPRELFSCFGAQVILAAKLPRAQQIQRWSGGYRNTGSSACELIPPDASLREHRPRVTQNKEHMAGIIACCFNYLPDVSGLEGFALPLAGESAAVAGGAGMRIPREMLVVAMTALLLEQGWETSWMPKSLRGSSGCCCGVPQQAAPQQPQWWHRPTPSPWQPGAVTGKNPPKSSSCRASHPEVGMGAARGRIRPLRPIRAHWAGEQEGGRKENPFFFLIWCLIAKGWGFSKPPLWASCKIGTWKSHLCVSRAAGEVALAPRRLIKLPAQK